MGTVVRTGKRWKAIIRKKDHPIRTKNFIRRAAAEQWMRNTEVEIEQRGVKGHNVDLGRLMLRYIEDIGKVKRWERTHVSNLRRFARELEGVSLGELDSRWMVDYAKRRKVAPSTVAQELTYLSTLLRTAEAMWDVRPDWESFRKGRALLRKLGLTGRTRERDRRVEGDEIDRIKAELRSGMPVQDILDLCVLTGLRRGEVCRLRWNDIDKEKRLVMVRDRKHPTEKRGNNQWVPLLGDALEILLRQPQTDERIFPFNAESLGAAYRRARGRAGVKNLRLHDMRHEAVSRLFERGFSIAEVALVSGHRDWNQLRRYTNLRPESLTQKETRSGD